MRAVVFHEPGEPRHVLALGEAPEPSPGPKEVLLDVLASPVHPADLAFVRGTYRIRPRSPQIAGVSGVGRVRSDGGPFPRGTRVAFRWPGAWAERIAVPIERAFAVPEGISDEGAAQLAVNPITAWGLLAMAEVRAGDVVGVTAPRSNVAELARVLAAMRGARTIDVLPPTSGDAEAATALREASGGEGLAALLDSVGGTWLGDLFAAMRPGGTVVAYGVLRDEPISVRNRTLIYANLTWRGFGIDRWSSSLSAAAREEMLDVLGEAARGGRLPLPVRARFELTRATELTDALAAAEERRPGKVVLRVAG